MNRDRIVYLDYNATTPVDARVQEAMLPYFSVYFANPASRLHMPGRQAADAVERARAQVADLIQADPAQIVFTSGATEALNWAIKGLAWAHPERRHVLTVATEHKAVLEACRWLSRQGWELTILGVDREGRFSLAELEAALRPDTLLVAVMWANNETGLIHPVAEVVRIARSRGVYVLTDATQAVGKIPVDVRRAEVDLLAASAHKFYGPKGWVSSTSGAGCAWSPCYTGVDMSPDGAAVRSTPRPSWAWAKRPRSPGRTWPPRPNACGRFGTNWSKPSWRWEPSATGPPNPACPT